MLVPREGASGPSPSGALQTAAEEPLARERGAGGAASSRAWCPGSGGFLQAGIQPCPPHRHLTPLPPRHQRSCKRLPRASPCAEPTGDTEGLTVQGGMGKGRPADRRLGMG